MEQQRSTLCAWLLQAESAATALHGERDRARAAEKDAVEVAAKAHDAVVDVQRSEVERARVMERVAEFNAVLTDQWQKLMEGDCNTRSIFKLVVAIKNHHLTRDCH